MLGGLFHAGTGDIATCMYYTGLDPVTGEEVFVARHLRDRKLQRALMQFFKPENDFVVREALLKAGLGDLIANACGCLIPAHRPPNGEVKLISKNFPPPQTSGNSAYGGSSSLLYKLTGLALLLRRAHIQRSAALTWSSAGGIKDSERGRRGS